MRFCKYCDKEMKVDDVHRDRNGNIISKWYLCECGGACYIEKVKGFWKSMWTKEGKQ